MESQMVEVPAAVGSMPAFLARPKDGARVPCVLVIQEAFGLNDKIKACAPFYGGGLPAEKTAKLKCPVLAFFGEKDAYIPLDSVEQLQAEARRYGKAVEVVVYPGAEHGFFCNERASYQKAAAEDAWARLKKFFATHLKA